MKLKDYRSLTHITQKQFAKQIGVSELSVIKYEDGSTIPSKVVMLRIFEETAGSVAPNDFYNLEDVMLNEKGFAKEVEVAKEAEMVIGLMTGTSKDGIDVACLLTDGEQVVKSLYSGELLYDADFKLLLQSAEYAVRNANGDLAAAAEDFEAKLALYLEKELHVVRDLIEESIKRLRKYLFKNERREIGIQSIVSHSTELHAKAVEELIRENGIRRHKISLVGYHGQTLFHRPQENITVQAGNAKQLAELLGIDVVFDFRKADVQAGGQGAPFAPLYHRALARQAGLTPSVIVNCGGIANVTILGEAEDELYAYDTGPGNALIDRLVFKRVGKQADTDGVFGRAGKIDDCAFEALKRKAIQVKGVENYLVAAPPKSLDVNDLHVVPELEALSIQDACRTLEAFTAWCIVDSLSHVEARGVKVPKLWILAGGGFKNPVIVEELSRQLKQKLGSDVRVQHASKLGFNGDALEAEIFAYLAVRHKKNLPLSVPGTTGVPAPLTGGELFAA